MTIDDLIYIVVNGTERVKSEYMLRSTYGGVRVRQVCGGLLRGGGGGGHHGVGHGRHLRVALHGRRRHRRRHVAHARAHHAHAAQVHAHAAHADPDTDAYA